MFFSFKVNLNNFPIFYERRLFKRLSFAELIDNQIKSSPTIYFVAPEINLLLLKSLYNLISKKCFHPYVYNDKITKYIIDGLVEYSKNQRFLSERTGVRGRRLGIKRSLRHAVTFTRVKFILCIGRSERMETIRNVGDIVGR